MKKFIIKNKKNICLIVIVAIAFNFLFLPLVALADPTPAQIANQKDSSWVGQVISWLTGKTLLFISSGISAILGVFFGVILWLEAIIIDYIISPNNFSLVDTPIVKIGWGITRDIANMFFILILLIISFATVLRIKSWAISQLWWKVVVAALLINFSLVIAGFVIDFANILTAFFLNGITGGGSFGTITTKLAASMQILNFYNPANPTGVLSGAMQFGASSIAAVVGILLSVIGMVITVFVFGAAMIFLIVRILHLWLLLIFAPIVWMLWILPATSSYFSQWWNAFLKWTFFAPIFVFMIYLSLSIFDATGQFNPKVFEAFPAVWREAPTGISQVGMPAAIFQWILVIAMMFGSLIVAQKCGVMGAAASQKMLTGWGNDAKGWAKGKVRQQFTQWTQRTPPPPAGAHVPGAFRRFGAAIGNVASAVPGLRGKYLATQAAEEKAYQAEYDKVKNTNPAVVDNMLKNGVFVDQRQRIAWAQFLAEKNWFNTAHGYSVVQRQALIQQASRAGKADVFLAMDPQFAAVVPGRTIANEVRKIRPENASKLSQEAVTDPGVINGMVANFSGAHIQNAANAGRGDILNGIETSIRAGGPNRTARIAALRANNPRLAMWLSRSPGNTLINLN